MQQHDRKVILEEEKDSDPIFRVIFNKLKFLRGKLGQVDHIRTLDPKTLKTAQLNKLNKLPEIVQEIEKNQQFARYYKSILIDHNISNQKTDDLLKISTLLTVGRRIQTQRYCPKELLELYKTISSPIIGDGEDITPSQMSDEVVRVYHLLWEYLENGKYYSQCRDYMTYLEDIKQRKNEQGYNLKQSVIYWAQKEEKVESLRQSFDLSLMNEVSQKMEKMEIKSEVFKVIFDSQLMIKTIQHSYSQEDLSQATFSVSEKDIDYKEDCSTANPEGNSEDKDLRREPIDAIAHPEIVWIQKSQSLEVTDSYSVEKSEPNPTHGQPGKKKRSRKGKKTVSIEIDNVRKISEVYTEPATEKHWGKVKYVQKKSC